MKEFRVPKLDQPMQSGADPPPPLEPMEQQMPLERIDFSIDRIRARVPRVLHGAPRILIESGAPHFMLIPPSYSDDFLLTDLKRIAEPGGMSKHHPEIRQAVFDSLEHHPDLLQHYLAS